MMGKYLKCRNKDCGNIFPEFMILHKGRQVVGRIIVHKDNKPLIVSNRSGSTMRYIMDTEDMRPGETFVCCAKCGTVHLRGFLIVEAVVTV